MYEGFVGVSPLEIRGLDNLPLHVVIPMIVFPIIDCEVVALVIVPR
jgi:hypothetical protein